MQATINVRPFAYEALKSDPYTLAYALVKNYMKGCRDIYAVEYTPDDIRVISCKVVERYHAMFDQRNADIDYKNVSFVYNEACRQVMTFVEAQ